MKNKKWIFFVAPPAAVLVIGLCGELVKWLWNWLVPPILGLRAVDFWQALGLLLLCRILFGSWGGGGGGDHHHGRCRRDPREPISPEERERFRKGWGWGQAGQQEPNPENPAGPQPA